MRVETVNNINVEPKEKYTIHNVYILDCSGSMYDYQKGGTKYAIALSSINEELEILSKQTNVNYTNSLIEFGDDIIFSNWMQNSLIKVDGRYHHLGMTRLHDAIGSTLNRLLKDKKPNDRVLVKILTDGAENKSYLYKADQVKELIEKCEKNNFTITFIGTKEDTKTAINQYKLSVNNTLSHDNTPESIKKMSNYRTAATLDYASEVETKDIGTTTNFYSKSVN